MRLSASRTAVSALPKREPTTAAAITRKIASTRAEAKHSVARVASDCTEKPRMSLKSVMPLLPPKPHVVAEEREHQGEGHGLGDDREVDAGDAAPEGEPAQRQGEQARHQDDHDGGEPELVEAVPEPGQLLVVQEHHEVGQQRIAVLAAAADLAHQVHAHAVAAQREEGGVAEREDAAEAPDEIDGERQRGEAEVLADQLQHPGRHVERAAGRHELVQAAAG